MSINKSKLEAVKQSIIDVEKNYDGKNIASIVAKDLQFDELCEGVEYLSEFVKDKCICEKAMLVSETGEPYLCSACRCLQHVWGN